MILTFFLRFLFIFAWIIEKAFYMIYFIPAFVIVLIGWAFIWFPYKWIFGKHSSYRSSFDSVAEDTFFEVFDFFMSWPCNLLDIFEQYVKLK